MRYLTVCTAFSRILTELIIIKSILNDDRYKLVRHIKQLAAAAAAAAAAIVEAAVVVLMVVVL